MLSVNRELSRSRDSSSSNLKYQLTSQIPQTRRKLIAEFGRLYSTGIWVNLQNTMNYEEKPAYEPLYEVAEEEDFEERSSPQHSVNQEEQPIRPLTVDYNTIAEQNARDSRTLPSPVKRPINFLRKGSSRKYDPLAQSKTEEENSAEEQKRGGRKFSYLKRSSVSYEATPVNWNNNSRVDCWGKKSSTKDERKITSSNLVDFEVLEDIVESYVPCDSYFSAPARTSQRTSIPIFSFDSFFIAHYTEEIHPDMTEALDNHYNYLCSEDFVSR